MKDLLGKCSQGATSHLTGALLISAAYGKNVSRRISLYFKYLGLKGNIDE